MTTRTRIPSYFILNARALQSMQVPPSTKNEYEYFADGTCAAYRPLKLKLFPPTDLKRERLWYDRVVMSLFCNDYTSESLQTEEGEPDITVWKERALRFGQEAAIAFMMEFDWASYLPDRGLFESTFEQPSEVDFLKSLYEDTQNYYAIVTALNKYEWYFAGYNHMVLVLASTCGFEPPPNPLVQYFAEVSDGYQLPLAPFARKVELLAYLLRAGSPYEFFVGTWKQYLVRQIGLPPQSLLHFE
ncbi:MAG: hypothetical protein JJU11_18370 [Candidatus Sumerlaeia bacterium]|nr:hypothetical protein [Candidatus Sumerlaeia bacterium]